MKLKMFLFHYFIPLVCWLRLLFCNIVRYHTIKQVNLLSWEGQMLIPSLAHLKTNTCCLRVIQWHSNPPSTSGWTNPPATPSVQFPGSTTSDKVPRRSPLVPLLTPLALNDWKGYINAFACAHTQRHTHLGHHWWCPVCADLDSLPPLVIIL